MNQEYQQFKKGQIERYGSSEFPWYHEMEQFHEDFDQVITEEAKEELDQENLKL